MMGPDGYPLHPHSINDFRPAKPNRLFIRYMRLVDRFYMLSHAKLICDPQDLETVRRPWKIWLSTERT